MGCAQHTRVTEVLRAATPASAAPASTACHGWSFNLSYSFEGIITHTQDRDWESSFNRHWSLSADLLNRSDLYACVEIPRALCLFNQANTPNTPSCASPAAAIALHGSREEARRRKSNFDNRQHENKPPPCHHQQQQHPKNSNNGTRNKKKQKQKKRARSENPRF